MNIKTYIVTHEFIVKAKNKEQAEQLSKDDPSAYHQQTTVEEL